MGAHGDTGPQRESPLWPGVPYVSSARCFFSAPPRETRFYSFQMRSAYSRTERSLLK